MAPTIRTCSLALAAALAGWPVAAEAKLPTVRSGASTFVAAKAAADAGDARRSAILFASLAAAEPGNGMVARRALAQAILAGDMPLALTLARSRPAEELAPDARLLLLADELKAGKARVDRLAPLPPEIGFLEPFVRAWLLAERGGEREAVRLLGSVGRDNLLFAAVVEHQALIWLDTGRVAEARPLIARALAGAGGRGDRLRIAFAAALLRKGERNEALALLGGRDPTLSRAAAVVGSSGRLEGEVRTAASALSELLLGLALTLGDSDSRALPLSLVQVARHADSANPQLRLVLALMLERSGRSDDAVAVLRAMPEGSPFVGDARDAEIRSLLADQRHEEALARARAFLAAGREKAEDWVRLGDVLDAMGRHAEAAEAYGRAVAAVQNGGAGPEPWTLHLLRGAALEQGDSWPEAKSALELARTLAPDNPIVLNYLGYARLERGEQLDEAEALIARASKLAPDDASITDSLGWAQFKRGRVDQAIDTLGRAAAADPLQAEIHEHLGDALYTAGRKFEARHAWAAALVTAGGEVRGRVEAKLAAGLDTANAAP